MKIEDETFFVKDAIEGNNQYLIFQNRKNKTYYLWNRGGRYVEGIYEDISSAEKAMENFSEN